MASEELKQLDPDAEVAEQLVLFKANRERRRVINQLDRGDHSTASLSLRNLRDSLLKMPASQKITRELDLLNEKLSLIESDPMLSRKRLSRESLRSSINVYEGEDEYT